MKPLENTINQLLNRVVKLQVAIDCQNIPQSKIVVARNAIKNATQYVDKICEKLEVS